LVPSQGHIVDVHDTPVQTTATSLPSVRLCRILAPSEFHCFDSLKKHPGSHSC
jgi:type IV secretory pathway protease TraF